MVFRCTPTGIHARGRGLRRDSRRRVRGTWGARRGVGRDAGAITAKYRGRLLQDGVLSRNLRFTVSRKLLPASPAPPNASDAVGVGARGSQRDQVLFSNMASAIFLGPTRFEPVRLPTGPLIPRRLSHANHWVRPSKRVFCAVLRRRWRTSQTHRLKCRLDASIRRRSCRVPHFSLPLREVGMAAGTDFQNSRRQACWPTVALPVVGTSALELDTTFPNVGGWPKVRSLAV